LREIYIFVPLILSAIKRIDNIAIEIPVKTVAMPMFMTHQ